MANMSYVRFENTLRDLRDCWDHLFDDLGEDEEQARKELVRLCREIAENFNDEYDEE